MHNRDIAETNRGATPPSFPRTGQAAQPAVPESERDPAACPSQRERVQLSLLLCPGSDE
jgi:hypothetical protein